MTATRGMILGALLVSALGAKAAPIDLEPGVMAAWFGEDQSALPDSIQATAPLDRDQVAALRGRVWNAYASSRTGMRLRQLLPAPQSVSPGSAPTGPGHALPAGDRVMPYYFLSKGNPSGPRPLFIALHGGGSAGGQAPSPHGWPVNTREWHTQARLAADLYPTDALYVVPRMADDNHGRWYFDYCQDAYDQFIRAAILGHQVDPDRVYLIGISEGAYTAYRMGAFMADRWAGAGAMAGGEPLANAPPENLRNVAFRSDIGAQDTQFDRIGLNHRYRQALEDLQRDDPDGFVHRIEVHEDRGHAIDYQPCPEWVYRHTRDARPTRVRWKRIDVHGRVRNQCYWLACEDVPNRAPLEVDARIDRPAQTIHLEMNRDGQDAGDRPVIRIYLDDDMLDLDQPVQVVRNGITVYDGLVPRRLDVMMRSLAERGDPSYLFPAEVIVPPPPGPDSLDRTAIERETRSAYAQCLAASLPERLAELDAREIVRGAQTMKWSERIFGDAPDGARSLWISMHGGGGTTARINDQQWRNQEQLYQLEEGIYLAPRAPTDTWDLWHQEHIDPMFDRLIENYVALRGVDPNRVYLLGYSAGGDGVWQLAPRMADRFAAAAMMAGHPNESSLLGLRNLPFAIYVGGKDRAYGRDSIAAEKARELTALEAGDPGGYIHRVRIYPDLGHWMNGRDREALPWMASFTRDAWPAKLVWYQDDVTHDRYYWLKIPPGAARPGRKIEATVRGQDILLSGDVPPGIRIRLSEALLNLDAPVTVSVNGQIRFSAPVPRDPTLLAVTLAERLDPTTAACSEILIP